MPQPDHGTRKQSQPGAPSPAKKVLVGVRVPADFHRRIRSELVRRDLSLQEMVVDALKQYFRNPVDWHYAATTFVRHPDKLSDEEVARRNAWLDLWTRFVGVMPRDKVELYTRALEWDLLTLRSSRRKPTWRPVAPKKKG